MLGKGNPEDFIEFSGAAHVSKRITSSWIFTTSWEKRLPSSPAPLRVVSLDYSTLPTALPRPSPALRADALSQLRCSLSREPSVQGAPRCALPRGTGGGSALWRLEPGPQAARPPLAAVRQHPSLLPQGGFPSSFWFETFSFQLCLNYSHPIPFE